ncbi:hypothetical protein JCM3774_006166 [Rhodotorula dairenensis]
MARPSRRSPPRHKHRFLAAAALVTLTCTGAAASLLSAPFDALRRRGTAAQAGQLLAAANDPLVAPYSNSTAARPTVVSSQPHLARYGHSAVYLPPPTNSLLLIGGQVGTEGTAITNEVLHFRLASTFLWGDDRPADSAIPDNPAVDPTLSSGLPPSAWSAAAVDPDTASTWFFGGVTPDCETDSLVHTLASSLATGWTPADVTPRAPPRRRQATAIPVTNATTSGTDIWVLGGIADEFTCSVDTIGYVGLDRYDTLIGSVESMPWDVPAAVGESTKWAPPVSDYSATLLNDGASIAVIGGQTAMGDLVHLDEILVFDVNTREWAQEATVGQVPSPRMGHSAVLLPSGSILVYGGLSPNHVALSDSQIFDPLTYTWTRLEISDASMASPALAWHTATLVEGGTVVVAFGLDGHTGAPSNRFWFLTVDEPSGTYTWTDTFDGNGAATASAIAARSSLPMPKLARRGEVFAKKALEFIPNPKAETDGSTTSSSLPSTSPAAVAGNGGGNDAVPAATAPTTEATGQAQVSTSSTVRYTPPMASKASSSASVSSASTPKSRPASTAESDSSTSTGTIIGASVGAIGGAVALVGLAFYLLRRKAAASSNKSFRGPIAPAMTQAGGGNGGGDSNAPFVSQLLYTRPVQARNLSLGSTAPAFSPRNVMDADEDELPAPGEDMAGVGSRGGAGGVGLGVVQDPFADQHRVNEVGQLERSGSGASSTNGVVGASATGHGGDGGSGVGAALQASVRSIPFLSSISRTTTASPTVTTSDSFTAPAPTLASRRGGGGGSIRRPRGQAQQQDVVPMPGTPAELIGMAITSDDGHDALPYLMVSSPSETSHDGASVGHAPVVSPTTTQIPAILRPGTPLRVANPDPFADQ